MPIKTELLEKIGLTRSEINVYLALLELGSSTTGPIVDRSKATSSKIYEILDRLMQKGLVSYVIKSGTKHFEAADPKRILDYMREKKEQLKKQEEDLKQLIPELELKKKLSELKSEATIYKGIRGLETAFYDALSLLKPGEEVLSFGIPSRTKTIDRFFVRWGKDRAKKKIKSRLLFDESARGEQQTIPENAPLAKIKFQPKGLNTPAAINIFGSRTIIFPSESEKEPLLIVIDSKDIADSFKTQFENMWTQKVRTYEGTEAIKGLFRDILSFGDYVVFAEGMKVIDVLGAKFFLWWQEEKRKQGIKARGIMGEKYRQELSVTGSHTDFRFIPGYETPGVTFVFEDRIISVNFSKKPTAYVIEDKETAANQKAYFELLWNQDTTVAKGMQSLKETLTGLIETIKPGDTYDVIGAGYGSKEFEEKYFDFFQEIRKVRHENKVGARLLYEPGTESYAKGLNPADKYKFMPYKSETPVAIIPYADKTLLIIEEKEPTVITINDRNVTQAFHRQFETLWGQDTIVVRGFENVTQSLYAFLEEINGKSYNVIGGAFGAKGLEKKYVEFFKHYHKHRLKNNVSIKFLFQKDHTKHIPQEYLEKYYKKTEIKELPYSEEFPVPYFITEGKIMMFIQEEVPTLITINNKRISESLQKQFDNLWNQNITVAKGFDNFKKMFEGIYSRLDKEESYKVLGAGIAQDQHSNAYEKFFDEISKDRIKKKIPAKLLFEQNSKKALNKFKENYEKYAEVKYLPYKEESPVETFIEKDRVHISIQEEEPTIITINNKVIAQSFQKQFDSFWDQDVKVYTGFKNTTERFDAMLESLNKGEAYYVLGLSMTGSKEGYQKEWFYEFHKKRVKKGIKALMLCDPGHISEMKKRTDYAKDEKRKLTQLKVLSPDLSSPIQINLYGGDTVGIFTWDKEFRCFEVKSKELYANFKKHFDSLWEKDSDSFKGFEETIGRFELMLEKLNPGEEYFVLGASIQKGDKRLNEWLVDYHKRRIQKGVKANLLCIEEAYERVKQNMKTSGDPEFKISKVKSLSKEFDAPFQINLYKDKVLIFLWDELRCFEITSQKLKENFKNYFNTLWKIAKK
jgi:HTH-type transcriptional regulator, sugar sensing transcriptional regulator